MITEVEHAAKNRQEGGLAAAGWSHQHSKFAAIDGQIDVLQRLHPCWPAAKTLADVRSLDDVLAHRANTIAGSTRTTRKIAAIAETMHMTTVRPNSSIIKFEEITTCSGPFAVKWTTANPISAAMANPIMALSSA
jgi:hypothetical protein